MHISPSTVRAVMDLLYAELGDEIDIMITCLQHNTYPLTISTFHPDNINEVYALLASSPCELADIVQPGKPN